MGKPMLCCLFLFFTWAHPGWTASGWEGVQKTLGQPGLEQEGGIRFNFPRTDLNLMVQGLSLEPSMGLTSWISFLPFKPTENGPQAKCLLMGELVLVDQEVPPVT